MGRQDWDGVIQENWLGIQNKRGPEVHKLLQREQPALALLPPWQDLLTENPCMTPDTDLKERGFCSTAEEEQKKISRNQQKCTKFDKSHKLYINYKPMKFKKSQEEHETNYIEAHQNQIATYLYINMASF